MLPENLFILNQTCFTLLLHSFYFLKKTNSTSNLGNAELKYRRGNHLYGMGILVIFLSHSNQNFVSRSNFKVY
jgi:hypothetical protein